MPELPEVETTRKFITERFLNAGAVEAIVQSHRGPLQNGKQLVGKHLMRVERIAKYLLLVFQGPDEPTILLHLRMTGSVLELSADSVSRLIKPDGLLDETPTNEALARRLRLALCFENGRALGYVDPRGFGTAEIYAYNDARELVMAKTGPEPQHVDEHELLARLQRSRRSVKDVLLDQRMIAGIGNIYADEALFAARIAPHQLARQLSPERWRQLLDQAAAIMERAIELGGSSVSDFYTGGVAGKAQELHQVYGKKGQPCARCQTILSNARVAGRGTVWCSQCQQ